MSIQIDKPATPRQLKFIQAIAREIGIGENDMADDVQRRYGKTIGELTIRDASAFIEQLQSHRMSRETTT